MIEIAAATAMLLPRRCCPALSLSVVVGARSAGALLAARSLLRLAGRRPWTGRPGRRSARWRLALDVELICPIELDVNETTPNPP
jgi:hypothetical protein